MSRIESWLLRKFVSPALSFKQKAGNFIALFVVENLWVYAFMTLILFLWPMMGLAPSDPMEEFFNAMFGPTPQFLFFVTVILAPITEEIIFRWFPLKVADALPRKLFIPFLVFSQFIFGYAHGLGPIQIMIQGLGGFGMMWLYVRNGRHLGWTISYHILWNLCVTLGI